MNRPTWDETWLNVAHAVGARSVCSRAQVGAAIVDTRNRIVATGYNGPPAGWWDQTREGTSCDAWCLRAQIGPDATTYDDCPTVHAEMNALMFADRSSYGGGTLYVTSTICMSCAKAVANCGVARVVLAAEDEDRSYRNPGRAILFLRSCGLEVDVL